MRRHFQMQTSENRSAVASQQLATTTVKLSFFDTHFSVFIFPNKIWQELAPFPMDFGWLPEFHRACLSTRLYKNNSL
jgi:hypothetical protein